MTDKNPNLDKINKDAIATQLSVLEDALLRCIADLEKLSILDPRWKSIASTHFEQGFMALKRSLFDSRVHKPEKSSQ